MTAETEVNRVYRWHFAGTFELYDKKTNELAEINSQELFEEAELVCKVLRL